MKVIGHLVAILVFYLVTSWSYCSAECGSDDVAVYKVVLKTLWSEEDFPKDYPTNRPKAQWSKIFGQSHNSSYVLYKLGDVAREVVRSFAQLGKIDNLVEEGDENPKVYDQFSAGPIVKGVGETENMVFVNSKNSLVSLICKLVPSPDWFVGVDSLDLCVDSSWVDEVTLDLVPLDAGAASGLTFTAPKWETSPPEVVTRHAPRYPDHPAAGFYYPHLRVLPTIAKVEFIKLKEYTTKELNELTRKELMTILKQKDKRKGLPQHKSYPKLEEVFSEKDMTTKNYIEKLKDLEEEPVGTPVPNLPENEVIVVTRSPISSTTEGEFGNELQNMDDVILAVANGRRLGLGKHLPRHFRSRLHHAVNKLTPDDCLVSQWGEWTPCSVTCGFGDMFRTRSIIRESTSAGRKCPPLQDRKHCGNVNSCYDIEYFDW